MAHIFYPGNAETYIREVSGSTLKEFHVTAGGGLIFYLTGSSYMTSSTTSSVSQVSQKSVVLCSAYTPTATGADAAEVSIPYSNLDAINPVSWSVTRISLRTQTTESVSSSLTLEKSSGTGAFSATALGSLTLPVDSYEITTGSLGYVISGDKVRFNVTELGTATNWTVITEILTKLV